MPDAEFKDIKNKDPFTAYAIVQDTSAATTANYGVFFTAMFPCEFLAAAEAHKTAGTDGSAVTLNIEKLTTGQALGAGVNLLSTAFNLKSTANTPQFAPSSSNLLTSTVLDRVLAKGDRLALRPSGTLTTVAHVSVTAFIKPTSKGHYALPPVI